MKMSSLCLAAAAVVCTVAGSAYATWAAQVARGTHLMGKTHVNASGLGTYIALTGFAFNFESGDSRVQSLGFMPEGERVDVVLADAKGDDAYNFQATYAKLSNIAGATMNAGKDNCFGECTFAVKPPAPPNPEDATFILRGFRFTRESGDDHIRRIAVRYRWPDRVDVAFRGTTAGKFKVEIEYGYIGKTFTKGPATATGVRQNGEKSLLVKASKAPGTGLTMVQGFDVQFENGTHHLGAFGITRASGGFNVQFNDQNYDDKYSVQIDYAALNEG
jgi:hypothetical protein